MAYDPHRQENHAEEARGGYGATNPYDSVLGGEQAASSMMSSTPGMATANIGQMPKPAETPYGGALPGADSGPSATGYVNFDRLYNANADVATREAGNRAGAAENAGKKATQGRTGAVDSFGAGMRAGTNNGPSADDYGYATGKRNLKGAPAEPGTATTVDQFRTEGGDVALGQDELAPTEGQYRAGLEKGAAQEYGGPNALSEDDAYAQLLQETTAAQQQAQHPLTGLNSTDADLLGAAGRPKFAEVEQKYGHLGDELDAANKASIDQAKAAAAKSKQGQDWYKQLLAGYDASKPADAAGAGGDTAGASGPHPSGYGSYDDFMNNPGWSENLHEGGMALSPADWLTRGLGEAGVYSGQNASEIFGKTVAGGVAPQDDWAKANVHTALQQVAHDYGDEAARYLYEHMSAEQWQEYLGMNSGAAARAMRQWLESAGYSKTAQSQGGGRDASNGTDKGQSQVKQAGYTSGEADQGTTAEEETARTSAYQNGWGSQYDEQKRNGVKSPVPP